MESTLDLISFFSLKSIPACHPNRNTIFDARKKGIFAKRTIGGYLLFHNKNELSYNNTKSCGITPQNYYLYISTDNNKY